MQYLSIYNMMGDYLSVDFFGFCFDKSLKYMLTFLVGIVGFFLIQRDFEHLESDIDEYPDD